MQNYKDPPPYPGHSKQVYTNQPGFRQSYSGSETSTDVSLSSNENLATTQRQEPQGEETQTTFNYHLDLGNTDGGSYSILERLGMPTSALDSAGKFSSSNLLNIPASGTSHQQLSATGSTSNTLGVSLTSSPLYSQGHLTVPQWQLGNKPFNFQGNYKQLHNEPSAKLGDHIFSSTRLETESLLTKSSAVSTSNVGNYSSYISSLDRTGSGGGGISPAILSSFLPLSSNYQYLSPRVPPVSTYHHPHPYVNTHWIVGSDNFTLTSSYASLNTSSPATYAQSGMKSLSATDKNVYSTQVQTLPPPPQYPGVARTPNSQIPGGEKCADIRTCRSYEAMDKMDIPRSHPDLRPCASSPGICMHDVQFQSPNRSSNNSTDDNDHTLTTTKTNQLVEILTEENRALKEEIAVSSIKVAKLQKFEMEIQKVHDSHEALVKCSQKQESLWLAMRRKYEEKIQALETASRAEGIDPENRVRIAEKDALISKLLSQNHELSLSHDQLEGENSQLSLSLTEQRARVDILENALFNAQSKILALEEEFHKKQTYASKVDQLQKAVTSLQFASEKQQQKEKAMRTHLEKELEMYKTNDKGGSAKRPELGKDDVKSVGPLRKVLEEKDAKILQLESDLASLEQKYVKETTLRRLKMEESSQTPKEVRLAALEKNSSDMDKLIEEIKVQKLNHMEELHESQKKMAELEAKMKQLQTRLVEKEAMVKVFQRTPLAMARSSSLHALCHSSLHSPRPSLISPHSWITGNQASDSSNSYKEFSTIRHVKSGSASAIEHGRKMSMEDELLTRNRYFTSDE